MFAALVAIYFVYSRVFLLPGNCEVRSKVRRVQVELLSMNFTVLACW